MRKQLKPEQIIDIVLDYYEMDRQEALCKLRWREYVTPRQVCCYMIRYNTRTPLTRIGKYMQGNKERPMHHTTVLHSIQRVFDLMEVDDNFEKDIEAISANIKEAMKVERRTRKDVHQQANTVKPKIVRMPIFSEHEKVIKKYI